MPFQRPMGKIAVPEITLPEKFYRGVEQFNRQEFFEAHETLESVWKECKTPDRIFIQGIIQIAAGCHHFQHSNSEGARSLFYRGLAKIEPFKPVHKKVDVEMLIKATSTVLSEIESAIDSSKVVIFWPRISIL